MVYDALIVYCLPGAPSIRAYGIQDVFISQSEEMVDFNQSCNYPNMIAMRYVSLTFITGLIISVYILGNIFKNCYF